MRLAATLIPGVAAFAMASTAVAGAWTQPRGRAQVIVKYEDMRADQAFDPAGDLVDLPVPRRDVSTGVFAEYGLTDRLTLQFKGDGQEGRDQFVDYEGRGPLEIGLTWQAWRKGPSAVSLYAGYASGGEGRNAGYASPGVGDEDVEMRASAGTSFETAGRRGQPDRTFVELQAARRFRSGLADETRVDATIGGHFGDDWMVLGQAFGGVTADGGARWLSVETSVVRRVGDWSVQAGWREAVAGRESPAARGLVLAVWRRF